MTFLPPTPYRAGYCLVSDTIGLACSEPTVPNTTLCKRHLEERAERELREETRLRTHYYGDDCVPPHEETA